MSEREISKEKIREEPMVRCLECFVRIGVEFQAKEVQCSNCGTKYLIYWPTSDVAKIKGIVS